MDVRRLRAAPRALPARLDARGRRGARHAPPRRSRSRSRRWPARSGTPLVEPDGRRVRLTPAGQRLADHAVTILAAVDAARLDLDPDAEPAGWCGSPASPPRSARSLLPAIADLAHDHPGVEVRDPRVRAARGHRPAGPRRGRYPSRWPRRWQTSRARRSRPASTSPVRRRSAGICSPRSRDSSATTAPPPRRWPANCSGWGRRSAPS